MFAVMRVAISAVMRVALGALVAGSIGGAAPAQDAAEEATLTPFPGRALLDRIEAGDVWCLEPRPEDGSCAFILRTPSLLLMSDGPLTQAVGYWLIPLGDGDFVKHEQVFSYFVVDDRVCLRGPDVESSDSRFYSPATRLGAIVSGDQRLPPNIEGPLQEESRAAWATFETTCWSYAQGERIAAIDGPEIVMRRYHDGVEQPGARVGAIVDAAAAETLQLHLAPF